ncbi:hypothetical protein O181_102271 [Austropuccinia psidii MF-1]|uniref:Uncharacterized protein n=1 Tax=Austropuccinia psidii MF-1 TaxID=1389203 RepID=A0A9Q3JIC1_9BASI|nr:hypothetical protein [Austropuccinia psidii MF-1]
MEDSRTSTNSQRLATAFNTLIEIQESDISAIPVVRPELFPIGNNRDIPVSVEELVYGSKTEGMRTSAKALDGKKELLSSSEEFHVPRKDRGPSEGLGTRVLQRKSPIDKSLVEKPKQFVIGTGEKFGPREEQQPSEISSSLYKQESSSKSSRQGQAIPK